MLRRPALLAHSGTHDSVCAFHLRLSCRLRGSGGSPACAGGRADTGGNKFSRSTVNINGTDTIAAPPPHAPFFAPIFAPPPCLHGGAAGAREGPESQRGSGKAAATRLPTGPTRSQPLPGQHCPPHPQPALEGPAAYVGRRTPMRLGKAGALDCPAPPVTTLKNPSFLPAQRWRREVG